MVISKAMIHSAERKYVIKATASQHKPDKDRNRKE